MKKILLLFILTIIGFNVSAQSADNFGDRYLLFSSDEKEEPIEIKIFPNPATDFFQINESENIKKVMLINMLGKTIRVFEAITDNKQYNVSDLPRGMYLIQIVSKQNKILTTKRIKKQ